MPITKRKNAHHSELWDVYNNGEPVTTEVSNEDVEAIEEQFGEFVVEEKETD